MTFVKRVRPTTIFRTERGRATFDRWMRESVDGRRGTKNTREQALRAYTPRVGNVATKLETRQVVDGRREGAKVTSGLRGRQSRLRGTGRASAKPVPYFRGTPHDLSGTCGCRGAGHKAASRTQLAFFICIQFPIISSHIVSNCPSCTDAALTFGAAAS